MKILCYGSLNIDHVYTLARFPQIGETMHSLGYRRFSGGKGLNQAIAISKAGQHVHHAGKVGYDGDGLLEALRQNGVNTDYVARSHTSPSGHALIEVVDGKNAIILHSGSNTEITNDEIDTVLSNFSDGDILVLQNEINNLEYIINRASERCMHIVLNPSPMDDTILSLPLDRIGTFVVNEVEGAQIADCNRGDSVIEHLTQRFPHAQIVLTLGKDGVMYSGAGKQLAYPAVAVQEVLDTTGAGDTFLGYFVAGMAQGMDIESTIERCLKACAICITRHGASASIPHVSEIV